MSLEKHTERIGLLKLIRIHCKNSSLSQTQQVWREYAVFPYHRYHIPVVKTSRNIIVNRGQAAPAPCSVPAGRISGCSVLVAGQSVVHYPLVCTDCTARSLRYTLHLTGSCKGLHAALRKGKEEKKKVIVLHSSVVLHLAVTPQDSTT